VRAGGTHRRNPLLAWAHLFCSHHEALKEEYIAVRPALPTRGVGGGRANHGHTRQGWLPPPGAPSRPTLSS
jgi:hypothetical protein